MNLQEVDFAIGPITITKDRADVVDFMTPFWFEPVTFIIKTPEENTWNLYVDLFSVCLTSICFFDWIYVESLLLGYNVLCLPINIHKALSHSVVISRPHTTVPLTKVKTA